MSVPKSCQAATVRGIFKIDAASQRVPFSLDLSDGSVVRVHVSLDDARTLVRSWADRWPQGVDPLCHCHPPRSSANPSEAVSTPLESDSV